MGLAGTRCVSSEKGLFLATGRKDNGKASFLGCFLKFGGLHSGSTIHSQSFSLFLKTAVNSLWRLLGFVPGFSLCYSPSSLLFSLARLSGKRNSHPLSGDHFYIQNRAKNP